MTLLDPLDVAVAPAAPAPATLKNNTKRFSDKKFRFRTTCVRLCWLFPQPRGSYSMVVVPDWANRPAIVWDSDNHAVPVNGDEDNKNPNGCDKNYWNEELFSSLITTTTTTTTTKTTTHGNDEIGRSCSCSTMSYRSLVSTAALLVVELRQSLLSMVDGLQLSSSFEHDDDDDVTTRIGIPLAVGIPEGPLLPLAVLVVHALNHPLPIRRIRRQNGNDDDDVDDASSSCFAILVPLEPSEPKDRNRHILKDVLPSKIFAVPGSDTNRLRDIVDSVPSSLSSGVVSEEGLYRPESLELVDFQELVQKVVHTAAVEQQQQRTILAKLETVWEREDCRDLDLQTLINMCADLLSDDLQSGTESLDFEPYNCSKSNDDDSTRRMSHIVYTSGTTGMPKGCISSIQSLQHYLRVKNEVYAISEDATVLLASALSFDPCLSDVLATLQARATLAIAPRTSLLGNLSTVIQTLRVTHILCTPTLFGLLEGSGPEAFPSLRVVALGGEPIPKQLRHRWARKKDNKEMEQTKPGCRLYATYGVTEACVYQTCGEVFAEDPRRGQYVGPPFPGLGVRICREDMQDALLDVAPGETGEVILYGAQLDEVTSYLRRPALFHKFLSEPKSNSDETLNYHYRTGDRGVLDSADGTLRILGRIVGEEGMVKVNGVRVELGEIEAALIDDLEMESPKSDPVVVNCLAKVVKDDGSSTLNRSEIHAYCVLSDTALRELGIQSRGAFPKPGIFVGGGPTLALLQRRCMEKVKAACLPKAFVIIPSLPLSPTGKKDRNGLPDLNNCKPLYQSDHEAMPLAKYGTAGAIVAENIIECLNLQPAQEAMLTSSVTFTMLGGDSLAATRITRALYAAHNRVHNTRHLGGEFGKLDGVFDVVHLLRSRTLGEYVDMLDNNGICASDVESEGTVGVVDAKTHAEHEDFGEMPDTDGDGQAVLYNALLQAATLGQSTIAVGLLQANADPNYGLHGRRLGKVKGGRIEQKSVFRSSPMHLACLKGDDTLVRKLLEKNSNFKSPDASGLYPLHLASSGIDDEESGTNEDLRRLECVKLLLEAGAPLAMRDGNKQSILHSAARAGHCRLLTYAMSLWKERNSHQPPSKHFFNWRDRWLRTYKGFDRRSPVAEMAFNLFLLYDTTLTQEHLFIGQY